MLLLLPKRPNLIVTYFIVKRLVFLLLILQTYYIMFQFENYSLRLLQSSDLNEYYQLVLGNRERLQRFFAGTTSRTKNLEDTREFILEMEEGIKDKSYFPYVLIENKSKAIIGFYDLKNIDWRVPKTEIGFFIDVGYAGRGVGAKALKEFSSYCFSEHGFEKLFLRTHKSNMGARKIAEKCGFEIEGTLRKDYRTSSGELVDVLYYGLLKLVVER